MEEQNKTNLDGMKPNCIFCLKLLGKPKDTKPQTWKFPCKHEFTLTHKNNLAEWILVPGNHMHCPVRCRVDGLTAEEEAKARDDIRRETELLQAIDGFQKALAEDELQKRRRLLAQRAVEKRLERDRLENEQRRDEEQILSIREGIRRL